MDQNAVVNEQTESGQQLIKALAADGFPVQVAFWAKPTDEGKWFLYLASSFVDGEGPATAYRLVHRVLRKMSELWLWIDPLDIRVVGLNDSLAKAALDLMKPKIPDDPFTVQNPRPYPGMTRFGGPTLGGVDIDGAYIYPSQPGAPV